MRNFKLIIILGLCSLTFLALQFCFMRYVSGQKKVRIYHILHNISILHRHIKRRHIINKTTNTSTKESFKCSQSVIIILHSSSTNQRHIYMYLGVWNVPEQMQLQNYIFVAVTGLRLTMMPFSANRLCSYFTETSCVHHVHI